ncbi:FAD-binding oxidoreductase [Rhodoplanes roseus]|uniref:FAD-binding oxidoreductase n=1 Tax=Rhodoplanes roseus TaxID=29409 RepID=A0A327KYB6_9BRAD|nr:FAD-binding oxidoreductase [Rhodoplanes roseus]RAI43024.1 FAD-binding oxidoreductase [Rhodoplanes roseus]
MSTMPMSAWGRLSRAPHEVTRPPFLDDAAALIRTSGAPGTSRLVRGLGRSYGDVCLNAGGPLVVTDRLDRFQSLDLAAGRVRAEAGMSLDRLLRVIVPRGWFVPVTPGTKFVTLGGAVANDVHGKNHETAGSFGAHVDKLGLVRSTGESLTLSRDENAELFAATIGGLGLTGFIAWVEMTLVPIAAARLHTESLAIRDVDDFFRIAEDSRGWPFTVAWVDCLAKGRDLGRGLFMRGRWAETGDLDVHRPPRLGFAPELPGVLLNSLSMRAFNALYRKRPFAVGACTQHYDPFFYPLDALANWNRLYGKRGFYQHQCVVPFPAARDTVVRLLETTAAQGQGSFLAVLKLLGESRSGGVLSFPMPGATLALDFPNKGESTRRLLATLSEIVLAAGGRLYPAKDAVMTPEMFRAGYPDWRRLEAWRDPAFGSDFWRRVTGDAA